jgi:hypothetical protein
VGVLKKLQSSPNLSEEEKKLLSDVAKTVEGLTAHGLKRRSK